MYIKFLTIICRLNAFGLTIISKMLKYREVNHYSIGGNMEKTRYPQVELEIRKKKRGGVNTVSLIQVLHGSRVCIDCLPKESILLYKEVKNERKVANRCFA